jgi:hypothetical protein
MIQAGLSINFRVKMGIMKLNVMLGCLMLLATQVMSMAGEVRMNDFTRVAPGYRIISFIVLGSVLLFVSRVYTQVRARRKRAGMSAGGLWRSSWLRQFAEHHKRTKTPEYDSMIDWVGEGSDPAAFALVATHEAVGFCKV